MLGPFDHESVHTRTTGKLSPRISGILAYALAYIRVSYATAYIRAGLEVAARAGAIPDFPENFLSGFPGRHLVHWSIAVHECFRLMDQV